MKFIKITKNDDGVITVEFGDDVCTGSTIITVNNGVTCDAILRTVVSPFLNSN